MNPKGIFRFLVIAILLCNPLKNCFAVETCASADSDPDGDGWGWENEASCKVASSGDSSSDVTSSAVETTEKLKSVLSKDDECIDPDGDGWGWIESQKKSCKVSKDAMKDVTAKSQIKKGHSSKVINPQSKPQKKMEGDPSECIDPDGDGWGWNSRLKLSCEIKAPDVESPFGVEDITDVVLVAGQSNALADGTVPDEVLDAPHKRVFVWTYDEGWKVASLKTQIWFKRGSPKNGGMGQLSPGFRIAKSIAQKDPKRVVGLIPTGVAGMSIKFWDESGEEFPHILKKVGRALSNLPKKDSVDLIWWMQGEADDPNAIDYRSKLKSLIERFRKSGWFSGGYFVANETVSSKVNPIIRSLNSDNDPLTCFSEGEGFQATDKVHFDEPAIRRIGDLVAEKYFGACQAKSAGLTNQKSTTP